MDTAVVGGSGFIGRHLVQELLLQHHAVTVYDRDPPLQKANVVWEHDAQQVPNRHHDAVFMLAAMADVVQVDRSPVESITTNVALPADVYASCVRHEVQRFLFASTIWVYDLVRGHHEDGLADVITGRNPYSSGKLCGEIMLRSLERHLQGTTRITVMRYGIPYGPWMRRHAVIPAFVQRMLDDEELVVNGSLQVARPFLHVRDLARGNVALLAAPDGTYNVSGERLISLAEIIDHLSELFGRPARVRVNEHRGIDTTPTLIPIDAMRALGWAPQVSLRDGLSEMIEHLSSPLVA